MPASLRPLLRDTPAEQSPVSALLPHRALHVPCGASDLVRHMQVLLRSWSRRQGVCIRFSLRVLGRGRSSCTLTDCGLAGGDGPCASDSSCLETILYYRPNFISAVQVVCEDLDYRLRRATLQHGHRRTLIWAPLGKTNLGGALSSLSVMIEMYGEV